MAILISNTNGLNTVNLSTHNARIIHSDKSILVMLIDTKTVESFSPDFFLPEEKLISVGSESFEDFNAKAWTIDSELNGTQVLKFYTDAQDWFEAVNLDLSYEYNEYVVGFIVTDKNTGRSANAQFHDRGNNDHALRFGCEGDETYEAFTEAELEAMIEWLREQEGVSELENAYDAAMELPKDEYGFHPIVNILAQGNGITQGEIKELAEQAE